MKPSALITTLLAAIGAGTTADAAVTAFSQTFYSTNTGLTSPSSNVVWVTNVASNTEMHTSFSTATINAGETFRVNFSIGVNGSPDNTASDGLRFGLLDLATLTNADGAHNSTAATGYNTRFNLTTPTTNATGGDFRARNANADANYVTISSVYGTATNFNRFGLVADGTTYGASYAVTRLNSTDNRVDFTLNGITRSYTQTNAAGFSFDTFTIGEVVANNSLTITLSSFDVAVIPEPSGFLLLGCSAIGLLVRRRR